MSSNDMWTNGVSGGDPPPFLRSPTPHLLASNNAPTPTESSAIRASLALVDTEIAAIYANPESYPNPSAHLTKCLQYQRLHQPILSPIREIPHSILRRIFQYSVYTDSDILPAGPGPVPHAWWSIAQISSTWRHTALSLSPLPRTLPSIPLTTNSTHPAYLNLLTTALQASQSALTLHIFGRAYLGTPDSHASSPIHPALSILLAYSHKWFHVSFHLTAPFNPTDFSARLAEHGLPILTHLTLSITGPPTSTLLSPDIISPIWRCKGILHLPPTPLLTSVSLSSGVPFINLPWSQLETYTESHRRTPAGAHRLVTTPGNRVTSLRVQSEVATVTSQPHHQCTQDHLEFLHLSFAKSESTAIGPDDSIFFYLRTPSLRELHLSAQDLTPIMKSLSIHSTRNLHTLVLRPPGATHTWDREIVSKILEGVPLLETLELHHVSRSILHIVSQESQRLTPNLKKLTLYYDSFLPLDGSSNEMFVPRMAVGPGTTPPIHSVFLIFQTPKDALDTLFVLEGWNLIYNLAEPLRARGKALAIEVSAVGRGDRGKGGEGLERLASKEARARRIDVVLRFLEGFEVPDVAYLRMLDIPHYLLVLARIDPLLIPDDVYYKLRARAHALLQSWKPLFMEEFEMRKWFRRGGGVVLGYMQSRDIVDSDEDFEDLLFEI